MTFRYGTTLVAFDIELMRPGCAIVAAIMGADPQAPSQFPLDSWLLTPTEGMRVYPVTPDQLVRLVAKVESAHPEFTR